MAPIQILKYRGAKIFSRGATLLFSLSRFHEYSTVVSRINIFIKPTSCICGALSKNRTCDSSLPRTCFTTRLLGQFENHGQIIRTSRKKSSKNRHRPILSGYFVFFQFCFMFNRYTIRFHRLLNCPILCPCVHLIILKIR